MITPSLFPLPVSTRLATCLQQRNQFFVRYHRALDRGNVQDAPDFFTRPKFSQKCLTGFDVGQTSESVLGIAFTRSRNTPGSRTAPGSAEITAQQSASCVPQPLADVHTPVPPVAERR